MRKSLVACAAAVLAIAVFPAFAGAHPDEAGELYIPWADYVGQERAQELTRGAPATERQSTPGADNLQLVGNSDKDGTTNSDLAFNGNLVYSGHYGGFRILDVRGNQPRVVVDYPCNGPQNDVSVHNMGGKTFLFQSIDSGQDREDCASVTAPIVGTSRVGYEGVRVFDVTNPAQPVFIDMIQTACGSHTHTLIPDNSRRRGDKAYIYVSSYPLGSGITPPGTTNPPGGADFKACAVPHKKISIIEVSAPGGQFTHRLREQALADDTAPYQGGLGGEKFIACHDIQAFLKKDIALGSCAGESQIWNISDRWRPGIERERNHTHIRRPAGATPREFEFMHSAFFSWDGKVVATMDETGGGVEARCFGPYSTDGYYYFYDVVRPGSPEPPLRSRYTIPRQQGTGQECVSHNGTAIPVKNRYLASIAYYQGGVSVVDFTNVDNPREVAFADVSDATGTSDEWSSYWYNGRIYSNSGLGREGDTANRGLDVWRPSGRLARQTSRAKRWAYSNPQTQEAWQAP